MYSHFMNASFNFVNIRNDFTYPLLIFRRQKINIIIKYKIQKSYQIDLKNHFLIIKIFKNKKFMIMKFTNLLNPKSTFEKVLIDFSLKTQFSNKITIYNK